VRRQLGGISGSAQCVVRRLSVLLVIFREWVRTLGLETLSKVRLPGLPWLPWSGFSAWQSGHLVIGHIQQISAHLSAEGFKRGQPAIRSQSDAVLTWEGLVGRRALRILASQLKCGIFLFPDHLPGA
jgi:hypothetical protein